MVLTTIEIIALVLVGFSVIKILFLLVNPKAWLGFAKGILGNSVLLTIVGLILSGGVLYLLIDNGMTIVQIFAVMAFMAAFMMMGLAVYSKSLVKMVEGIYKDKGFLKKGWFYMLLWIALIVWVVIEIFELVLISIEISYFLG